METFFRDIALHNEAYMIEHCIPCKRRFTHQELEPAIKAIREIECAKAAEINRAMMEALKP